MIAVKDTLLQSLYFFFLLIVPSLQDPTPTPSEQREVLILFPLCSKEDSSTKENGASELPYTRSKNVFLIFLIHCSHYPPNTTFRPSNPIISNNPRGSSLASFSFVEGISGEQNGTDEDTLSVLSGGARREATKKEHN
ncbi:hypothetical protein CEXT_518561 [Caerostris extrusa]|uniref:Uncharacterized protein n=1 Tax=Caerostris extrusa TaxID=172846 RepID=A0AAV4TW77_CAEEX|nr:hypothetical protein CEXT_518561 [Caerostris extrusa]